MKMGFSGLIKHMSINHNVSCGRCHARFINQTELKKHLIVHQPEKSSEEESSKKQEEAARITPNTSDDHGDDDFNWPLESESQAVELNNVNTTALPQQSSIRNAQNDRITCDKCGQSFTKNGSFKRHYIQQHLRSKTHLRHHTNKIDYPIIQKGKIFMNGGTVYKCSFCEKIITTTEVFLRHIRWHTGETPYKCAHCEQVFPVLSSLRTHSCPAVEPVKRFTCEVCGKLFKERKYLANHMRSHTGEKPYSCDLCGKKFPHKDSLWYHNRIHKDIRPHVCETCGLRCLTRTKLQIHARTHSGEKPYACGTCGKHFSVIGLLKNHIQVQHSGERPFACEICGQSYSLKKNLRRHMKVHI